MSSRMARRVLQSREQRSSARPTTFYSISCLATKHREPLLSLLLFTKLLTTLAQKTHGARQFCTDSKAALQGLLLLAKRSMRDQLV